MAPIGELRVALWGFGGVGRALARDLRQAPVPGVRVVAAADSTATQWDPDGLNLGEALEAKTRDAPLADPGGPPVGELVHDDALDAVVDLTPTNLETGEPSLSLHRLCARRGVHVVTANKGPLALHGPEVEDAFRRGGARLLAEATVGGGLPVVSTLKRLATGDQITGVTAVPNNSTSKVLSRVEDGEPFPQAVEAARRGGLLEADAMLDLAGGDAAAKAAILAQYALGASTTLDDVDAEGIVDLDEEDVRLAHKRGSATRLVARVTPEDVSVGPTTLRREHPLVAGDAGNGFQFQLEDGGVVTLSGPGAGPEPTATAVRRDLATLAATRAGTGVGPDGPPALHDPARAG